MEMLSKNCIANSTIYGLYVGDDMHMNGFDSPAVLRTTADVDALIAWLQRHRENPCAHTTILNSPAAV